MNIKFLNSILIYIYIKKDKPQMIMFPCNGSGVELRH